MNYRILSRLRTFAGLMFLFGIRLAQAQVEPHAVVLLYHHVSDSTPSATSISPARFEQHLNYLDQEGYRVLPLSRILQDLATEPGNLPDKAVAITFDDAYLSVYETAFPMLKARDMPFTLYVASQPMDEGWQDFFSWQQLNEMLANGAEVGGHSHSHDWLARKQPDESESDWHRRIDSEIRTNLERIEQQTGIRPLSFAYPFGESTQFAEELLEQLGLYGFRQQSGALGVGQNPGLLPRFPMATGFSDLQRLALALDTRPLPVASVRHELDAGSLSFRLTSGGYRQDALACFSASGRPLDLVRDGERVTLDLPTSQPGRNKINCTAPARDGSGDYYWFSWMWLSPNEDGGWPAW